MATIDVADIAIPTAELGLTFARSAGPGGQNVNKVNSKAVLRWNVVETKCLPDDVKSRLLALLGRRLTVAGDLIVTSQRTRDQQKNVADCHAKLREWVLRAVTKPENRIETRPTRGSVRRRLQAKRHRRARKAARRTPDDE